MRIVALVGPDGTGKSVQAARLVERLRSQGYRARSVRPVYVLFDPARLRGDADGAPALSPRRRRHRADADGRPGGVEKARSLIFVGLGYGYALATYLWLRAHLRKDEFVVCDRYFYQFFYDLGGPAAGRTAMAFPRPDRAFFLDASPNTLRARKPEPSDAGDYLDSVVHFYREIAPALGFERIDASADEGSVGEMIWVALWSGGRRAVT